MADNTPEMSPHRLEACVNMTPIGKKLFQYIEFDDDERFIAEVRKHPIGLVFALMSGASLAVLILAMTIFFAASLDKFNPVAGADTTTAKGLIVVAGFVLTFLIFIGTYIAVFVYRSSVMYITSEKVAQVNYKSLFNRSIIQLSAGNVEDVSYHQTGILPRIFHFGTLTVQTAGAKENSIFHFIPNPNENTQLIIQAHEEYVERHGN